MASTLVDTSPSSTGLIHLLKDISSKFSPEESEDVVQSLKRIYGERFSSLENQDLASCLDLLHKLGYVSNTKLTLIKEFVAPKSNKEKDINDAIDNFRASHPPQVELENELEGRSDDFMRITEKLLTGRLPVINLYGSAGVGKTTLAKKVCAEWQGKSYVIDLREAGDMRAIYRNIMNTLKLTVRESCIDMSFVVEKITENVRKISDGQPVLFLLDNVEQFTAGQGKEGRNLRTAFKHFLMELSEFNDTGNIRALNILLTSRTRLNDEAKVEDFELKSLRDSFSEKLLLHRETSDVNAEQKEKLLVACKGTPLLLKGVAAILRQERKAPSDLITELEKVNKDFGGMIGTPIKSKEEEDAEEKPFNLQEEDIDEGQLSLIKEMFNTLPSDSLKMSAVSISLIRGPFSASTVAKVLDISLSEAVGQLEGLAASAIIDVVNQEAKELMYDIHPLLRKYADSIKNDAKFSESYIEAKRQFVKHFISKMIEIARFIEIDFLQAFEMFASDRSNYEFVVEISLLPEYFSVGSEFHDIALIASVLNDMLPNEKQMELFHSWAEMCEDDGKSGSLLQAYFRCWEARQVLDIGGSYKAFEILQQAASSLVQVQDQSTESFKLTQGLLFYFKGEIHCQNRDYNKALEWLQSSLNLTEKLLGDDTNLARCYNAIGNCYYGLEKPKKALEFYTKALEMRKKLSGSEKHYDMPVYKNQIGTVHEDLGEYEEAVKWYKDALRLLEELKISGYEEKRTVYENQKQAVKWYKDAPGIVEQLKLEGEALFCRNLANVYAKQGKFKEAIEPAEKAYNIRIKRLGKHPDTVRSIYQQGVIQANLRDFDKALQLFRGAWEMEKSLEPGNHSPILRSIIKGVSDMCVTSEEREKFRQEALTNCKRFWREEKSSPVFSFTAELSKDIIDTIMGLLGDNEENRAGKKEYEEEALWFYDGMQSATEEGFYHEFDQETDNYELNGLLRDRDELLDMIIDLCVRLNKQVKLNKQRRNKMKLYKKILLRVDFVGAKGQEKVTLKRKVEQLYQDLGEKKSIPRFRENLLSTWQAQWEESKDGQESEEIMLARERMIKGILQLCQELKKEELRRKYVKEALTFNERLWEVKHSQMKRPKMKKFLREIKDLASSVGDHDRVKLYHGALQSLQDGKQPDTLLSSKGCEEERVSVAEQFPSAAEDKCAELEEEVEVDSEDNEDTAPEKTLIKRSTVTVEGDTWYLKEAAACITFHSGAVTESSLITCSLWSPRALSPLLYSNEALVSNVIELSHDNPPDLMSSGNAKESVTVALLHSASELKGYELVIKQLVDPDHNEWRDLKTNNIWHSSGGVPNWLIPYAEAPCSITRHSSFAVIWRLKSFHFSRHTSSSPEFTCVVPEYPDVSVTIPCNSVPADQDFRLTIKVQEFPSSELKLEGMLAGPVLHISCSQNVELLDPATIKVPLTLREDKKALATDLSTRYIRVLHSTTKGRSPEWTEITKELETKAVDNNGIVTLQVKHFCRFALLVDWLRRPVGILKNLYRRLMLQRAGFKACLCRRERPSHYLLTLCCYPLHLDLQVNDRFNRLSSAYFVHWQGEGQSKPQLCNEDKMSVHLSDAFTVEEKYIENFFLVFRGTESSEERLPVSIGDLSDLHVHFFKQQEGEEATETLCKVFIIPRSPVQVSSFDYIPHKHGEVLASQSTISNEVPEQEALFSTSAALKVTLLGSEWGSSAGGLSTLNRELAIHLARHPKVKVSLLVPEGYCNDEVKREADEKYGITVVDAKKRPDCDDHLDWLSFPPEDLSMDIVIGHGKKLGKQGKAIRHTNLSRRWIQVVHTAPEDLAKYKGYPEPIAEGEKKHEDEIDLCKRADLVVPIGPRLEEIYSSYLRRYEKDLDILSLTPGLFEREFGDLEQSPKERSVFKVLLFGRGDDEDFELKGYDIAAKAFADERLKERFHLVFVGAPDGKQDKIMDKLLGYRVSREQLFVRRFKQSRQEMKDLLCEVDLAIMPSRSEGFGLVALEALSAGLPILVGRNSGFAKALENIPFGESCIVDSNEPTKWAEAIGAVRDKHRGKRLEEVKVLRKAYKEKYSWERQCEVLVEKMWTMVHGTGSI